jgi:hypothetical protein
MATIVLRFTTPSGEYPGAYYRDYFTNDGLRRAEDHLHPEIARRILAKTYRGPDAGGVGVTWDVQEVQKESKPT